MGDNKQMLRCQPPCLLYFLFILFSLTAEEPTSSTTESKADEPTIWRQVWIRVSEQAQSPWQHEVFCSFPAQHENKQDKAQKYKATNYHWCFLCKIFSVFALFFNPSLVLFNNLAPPWLLLASNSKAPQGFSTLPASSDPAEPL